jgi:hypothetical protein
MHVLTRLTSPNKIRLTSRKKKKIPASDYPRPPDSGFGLIVFEASPQGLIKIKLPIPETELSSLSHDVEDCMFEQNETTVLSGAWRTDSGEIDIRQVRVRYTKLKRQFRAVHLAKEVPGQDELDFIQNNPLLFESVELRSMYVCEP